MAFTFADLKTELLNFGTQWLIVRNDSSSSGTIAVTTFSLRDIFTNSFLNGMINGNTPSVPSTATSCSSATAGALPLTNSLKRISIIGMDGEFKQNTGNTNAFQEVLPFSICDRLSHQGGLSANTSGTQSVNLPTAALTRYTDGVGVMIGMANYSTSPAGAIASDITASYTNSSGVSGRTTSAVQMQARSGNAFFLLPLQSGDIGAKSVESINLTAATGTAANFGIFLFKPLGTFLVSYNGNSAFSLPTGGLMGGIPEVKNDACLFAIYLTNTAFNTANLIITEI